MPRFDGTGPQGFGPRSGRGQGNCFDNVRGGMRGGMRGSGRRFGVTYQENGSFYGGAREISKDEQREILSSQLKNVDVERIAILKELENMEND